jgi:alpha-1,2-mannosyltransferase
MPAFVDGLGRLRRAATRRESGTPPRRVVLAIAGIAAVIAVALYAHRQGFADLALHRAAIGSWLAGDGLYAYRSTVSHLGFPLPPAAAFLLAPLATLPLAVGGWVLALAGVVALVLALIVFVGPVARRYARRRWLTVAGATALALATEPVRATLGLGHLDLLIFGLIAADVVALRRRARARSHASWWPGRPVSDAAALPQTGARSALAGLKRGWTSGTWAGAGIGLATALGATPVLFIGYLAVTRQWRAALTALGTAVGVIAAAFLLAPAESRAWFADVLWRIDRTGPVDGANNQSLAGVLARLYDSATVPVLLWLSFALLLLAVGLIRARSAHAEGDEVAAFTLVGLTGHIVGPITNTHALVWMLPAVLILVDGAVRRHAASRRPDRRGLMAARRSLGVTPPGLGRIRTPIWFPRFTGAGHAAAAGVVYLLLVVAPVWAYEHRLPETSHRADGVLGMLMENSFALALILLATALPWRPGASPAFHSPHRKPPAVRRPIPPARRPMP